MRYLALLALVLVTGCAGYKVPVYGVSGKTYLAPDLCAAELQCKQAGETACYYNSTTQTYPDGRMEVSGCKEVKH